jgi:hypothetical protein
MQDSGEKVTLVPFVESGVGDESAALPLPSIFKINV